MKKNEIQSILSELKTESENINSSDTDAINYINRLIEKLEQLLSEPEIPNNPNLLEYMQSTVEKFEASHPRLTSVVNDLMVKLAGLGV